MGCSIHPSARINAFIREFDLVKVGKNTSVKHKIRCRKFGGPWNDNSAPTLRFRSVSIGERCIVEGMIGPGASVGNDAKVEPLSVLREGSQVPAGVLADGNPAVHSGSADIDPNVCHSSLVLESIKVLWLVVQLYLFYSFLFIGQILWTERLPKGWRYKPLFEWVLLLTTASVLSILFSVVLKWVLIGRRSPGLSVSLWKRATEFVCDYHFRVSVGWLFYVSNLSKVWNLIMMMHGLDIDLVSTINVGSILPSKVDLIEIKRSFVSAGVSFGMNGRTKIVESSIGYFATISSGVNITRSVVRSMVHIRESQEDNQSDPSQSNLSWTYYPLLEIQYMVMFGLVIVTLIPSFELFQATVLESSLPVAVVGIMGSIVVQCFTWTCFLRFYQFMACRLQSGTAWHLSLYHIYLAVAFAVRDWSFWSLLWGTSFMGSLLRFLGSDVEGRLLYFGVALHDFYNLSFADRTIVDESIVFGHYHVYEALTLEPAHASGILHQGTYVLAGSVLDKDVEYGPWRTTVGSIRNDGDTIADNV
mmetsp:Transcript_19015/g.44307  ORF Transcript_19015/g.44307 Transcript_19015/m.44307 type:complete len:531 (-) Transcript_19015:478-2070(-)